MNWSAVIQKKGRVDVSGLMTYTIGISCEGDIVLSGVEVSGQPSQIQAFIADKVKTFAEAYELAGALPAEGEEIVIIEDALPTPSPEPTPEMSYNIPEEPSA